MPFYKTLDTSSHINTPTCTPKTILKHIQLNIFRRFCTAFFFNLHMVEYVHTEYRTHAHTHT